MKRIWDTCTNCGLHQPGVPRQPFTCTACTSPLSWRPEVEGKLEAVQSLCAVLEARVRQRIFRLTRESTTFVPVTDRVSLSAP